ncbi:MAG: YraN family protein [Clostridium sp.]
MSSYNTPIGKYGEDVAEDFLKNKDYLIIERNYLIAGGEIDIVCFKEGIMVFVEVKSRYNTKYISPCEYVDKSKRENILRTANKYINNHNLWNLLFRFDVIEVYLNDIDNSFIINHIENAFN